MKTLLYPFKYREPLTARWVKARYKASIDEITRRHTEWELTGPGEIRTPISGWFSPREKLVTSTESLPNRLTARWICRVMLVVFPVPGGPKIRYSPVTEWSR